MKKRRKEQNRILFWTLLVSMVLHVFFIFVTPYFLPALPEKEEDIVVEIDPALIEEWAKEQKKLQVVQTEKADNDLVPENAKFFGEKNQVVKKQTKAKKVDDFQAAQRKGVRTNKQLQKLIPKTLTAEGVGEFRKQMAQTRQVQQGGESASDDYLRDIEEGDQTLLNTKEFVYYGYFQRIRERLRQNWNRRIRSAVMRHVQSGGRYVSQSEYITRVIVVLDRHGRIKSVKLIGSSGENNLDRAAVDAFNAAGPFPNPPEGLIGKDGLIKIPWHFILQS